MEDWCNVDNAALNIILKQGWVDKNTAVAKAFVQAVAKAAKLIQTNPTAATACSTAIFPNRSAKFNQLLAASAAQHLSKDGSISQACSTIPWSSCNKPIRRSSRLCRPI